MPAPVEAPQRRRKARLNEYQKMVVKVRANPRQTREESMNPFDREAMQRETNWRLGTIIPCHAPVLRDLPYQNLCTRDWGHDGPHRCKAADVNAREATGREAR